MKKLSHRHLYWLLTGFTSVILLMAWYLPPLITLGALFFSAWRIYNEHYHRELPRAWVLAFILIMIVTGLWITFGHFFGRDASISLLLLLASLKLLETRTERDFMLMHFVAYFLLATLFIFDQSIPIFLLGLCAGLLLTASLCQTSTPIAFPISQAFQYAGKLLLQAVPVMLILFVLFPRLPGPIWGIARDSYNAMSGLNDQMQMGDVSQLSKDSRIAFRVTFDGKPPKSKYLYWRGPVLWQQKGNLWLAQTSQMDIPKEPLQLQSPPLQYTITLEPHNRPWLLLLDMPASIPSIAKLQADYTAISNKPVRSRIRYQASASYDYILGNKLDARTRRLALQHNPDDNPKTVELARRWASLPAKSIVQHALRMFHEQPYIYTLRPPPLGVNGIDTFLFETKKGFCEHYASSFVYLMRAAGVPARIVTGYQGGEFNPNGHYLIVRQSDAHAWAEVWLEDLGWVRVDPTAAVSPERVEKGIESLVEGNDALPLLVGADFPLLKLLYLKWDSINYRWNQWIIGYDHQRQIAFLQALFHSAPTLARIGQWMIAGLIMMLGVTALIVLYQGKTNIPKVQRYYTKYLKKLAPHDLIPKTGESAIHFATRVQLAYPAQASTIQQIANMYNYLMYSKDSLKAKDLERFKLLITTFKP